MKIVIILLSALFLTACFDSGDAQAKEENRTKLGKATFDKNCVSCHGKDARGTSTDWKRLLPNGKYPAPPLNGTAHAWHHSPKLLLNTINNGGVKLGGWMPAFKDKLTDKEKQATLDYLHSLWPKDIQQKYDARFK
ncbi:Cytochrome c, mono- and diheme variants [uncultured Gammaproteobacteria bacterium]|jgi:mono/diheme cytochrome c family protein|nr:Cytochrome c, mono- and diheme variants [uncultured Gammaproteobacteria bacterium]CAC9982444.1 Cytochrome c, mono- and diheme variants [uncultured Gammaproteobacteria bacterium]